MTKKKVSCPIHKHGIHCGYEEYEDGSIEIAPLHYNKMDNALLQETAIEAVLQSVIQQCQKLFIPVTEEKRRFWEGIKEDYALDVEKYEYRYCAATKILSRSLKEQKGEEAKP